MQDDDSESLSSDSGELELGGGERSVDAALEEDEDDEEQFGSDDNF